MSYLADDEIEKYCGLVSGVTPDHVAAASVLIDAYKGCSFLPTRRVEKVELKGSFYKGMTGRLRHYPCAQVLGILARFNSIWGDEKMVLDTECIDFDHPESAYFSFRMPRNLLFRNVPKRLEITYISGYKEIPEAVKRACGLLACNVKQMGGLMRWTSRDDYDVKVTLSNDSIVTQEIKGILRGVVVA